MISPRKRVSFLLFPFALVAASVFDDGHAHARQSQQSSDDPAAYCGDSFDCRNSQLVFSYLLNDDSSVAVKGKKRERRSSIWNGAYSYISSRERLTDATGLFRFKNCVATALYAEVGEKNTLFSEENIIATYFAAAGKTGEITERINMTCKFLLKYKSEVGEFRARARILQEKKKEKPLEPEEVWHSILVNESKDRFPTEDPEANVKRWQAQYCLFAIECRESENNPFAGK